MNRRAAEGKESHGHLPMKKRAAVYLAGMFSVSLGIVFCAKCGMGISPISSIPYVLSRALPLSFGTLTVLFHFLNTAAQMLIRKSMGDVLLWLQIPVAFLFGLLIDALNALIHIDSGRLAAGILCIVLSIFFTALGMVLMTQMHLVQNPPDGTVCCISEQSGRSIGLVKNLYDLSCVVISLALSLILLGRIEGFGIATIASAFFVGRLVNVLKKRIFGDTD